MEFARFHFDCHHLCQIQCWLTLQSTHVSVAVDVSCFFHFPVAHLIIIMNRMKASELKRKEKWTFRGRNKSLLWCERTIEKYSTMNTNLSGKWRDPASGQVSRPMCVFFCLLPCCAPRRTHVIITNSSRMGVTTWKSDFHDNTPFFFQILDLCSLFHLTVWRTALSH